MPPSSCWVFCSTISLLSPCHGPLASTALSAGSCIREVCWNYPFLVIFVGVLIWIDISWSCAKNLHLTSQLVLLAKWFKTPTPLHYCKIANMTISAISTGNCCPLMTRKNPMTFSASVVNDYVQSHLSTFSSIYQGACKCSFFCILINH